MSGNICGKNARFNRIVALIRKETRQMLRDKSTLALGVLLPITMLLLFGYGLSLDITRTPVAVVSDSSYHVIRDIQTALALSPYFEPQNVNSWKEAQNLLLKGKVDAIVRVGMRKNSAAGEDVQIIVNGSDSNSGRIKQKYLEAALALHFPAAGSTANVRTVTRIWYNEALESRNFLVPGVITLIMTLTGSLLTALVVAREWERGTYEALVSTPINRTEILIGKTVPYFGLGMIGLSICLCAAIFIFQINVRGSITLIVIGSALYLLVSLGLGLLISSVFKSQFIASQVALIVSFIPTITLSGFIFDLKSAPLAAYWLAHVFPAMWHVELLQTLFLVGNISGILLRDCLVLAVFAFCFYLLAAMNIHNTLE